MYCSFIDSYIYYIYVKSKKKIIIIIKITISFTFDVTSAFNFLYDTRIEDTPFFFFSDRISNRIQGAHTLYRFPFTTWNWHVYKLIEFNRRYTSLQSGLSPDRQGRDVSPGRQRRRRNYRRQSTTMGGYNVRSCQSSRSPESSSSCSSREPSPAGRAVAPATSHRTPIIRRQSTTEEILIARGFRRQVSGDIARTPVMMFWDSVALVFWWGGRINPTCETLYKSFIYPFLSLSIILKYF
jgi:hypothetical protein